METLHQIMLLCRPGFESECATEMMDYAHNAGVPAYINAKKESGYAQLVSAENRDIHPLLHTINFNELIFTRQWFASTEKISGLPEKNRTAPLVSIAQKIATELDCSFNDIELSYADTTKARRSIVFAQPSGRICLLH